MICLVFFLVPKQVDRKLPFWGAKTLLSAVSKGWVDDKLKPEI